MFDWESEADLLEVMGEATRDESTAIAQRLLAVGELYARRAIEVNERFRWRTDPTDEVAAEISAVQNISHARAVGQINYGRALRERLPQVAKVFARGCIDFRLVLTVINRTDNVDDDIMPALDAALARHVEKWMKLSKPKLRDHLDMWVAKYDPAAVRVPPEVDKNRYVEVDPASPGMAFLNGHIRAEDGAAVSLRLDELAATVCDNDPRTKEQRRADACGPLARREATLACQCGSEDCPAAGQRAAAASAVIHLLAEHGTVDGSSDKPGYLPGFGVLPAESVRAIATTATLKPMVVPTADCAADPGYRLSAATREFVRWRDLTCRWPGCDRPAWKADIDHTVPWPFGPTHPSNNKCYCRLHHLIKTFWGWSDQQLADGTVILTAPSGCTYRSEPHGATLFPALGQSTGELNLAPYEIDTEVDRTAMMPRRKQTRDQDRRDRINAERRQRTELIAEEERQRQAWLAANYQPPPF